MLIQSCIVKSVNVVSFLKRILQRIFWGALSVMETLCGMSVSDTLPTLQGADTKPKLANFPCMALHF